MRMLVIEDEPQLRRKITEGFLREGFQVDATGDGKERLYFATQCPRRRGLPHPPRAQAMAS